ncbi:cytochrome b/b6 domain-containing protein [soil metagenome]
MSDAVADPDTMPPAAASPAPKGLREVIYRHTVLVRITHWVNALAIFFMIGSGLNIFNAHPNLYWGSKGSEVDPTGRWLSLHAMNTPQGPRGVTEVFGLHLDTTGVFGWSKVGDHFAARGFPAWLTIPSFQDLADARHWHFFFAWILVLNGLVYLIWSLSIHHIQRDIVPTVADLKSIPKSIADHVRLKHPKGEEAKRYNVLQRLAYLGLLVMVLLVVYTGLTMSPGVNGFAPWMLDLVGGRQSARSIHFVCMSLITLFILVHVCEVFIAGPSNEICSMITGKYAVAPEHD